MTEPYKRIWWIASYPKSGSTWVRMVLNAYVTGFPPEINSAWQYATGDLQRSWYQLAAGVPVDELVEPSAIYYRPAALMNQILCQCGSPPSRDLALKTHHAKICLDGLPLIPPKLTKGALYVLRDPRAVVPSFANHMGVSIDEAIDLCAKNELTLNVEQSRLYHVLMSWSSHVDSWTIANKDVLTSVVKYEDLLADPDRTWPLVFKALGIDPDPDRLAIAIERASFANLRQAEDEHGFRENGKGSRFFRSGRAEAWKTELTADLRALRKQYSFR